MTDALASPPSTHPRWLLPLLGGLIVALVVANNVGNATWVCAVTTGSGTRSSWLCQQAWMSWINGNPLGLLALNSSNKYLLATSVSTDLLPAAVIATLRLLAPDPIFYLIGFLYGPRALLLARRVFPGSDPLFDQIESDSGGFRRVIDIAVVVAPNNPVCLVAGVARMDWRRFAVLNVVGTIGRVLLMRLIGAVFENQIRDVLDVVAQYQKWFTLASVVGVVTYVLYQAVGRRGLIGGVEELDDELGDDSQPAGPGK